jgi:hypothetical protein
LTHGAVADLNQRTGRAHGLFPGVSESNGANFDMHLIKRGSYAWSSQPLRAVLAARQAAHHRWINKTFSGS